MRSRFPARSGPSASRAARSLPPASRPRCRWNRCRRSRGAGAPVADEPDDQLGHRAPRGRVLRATAVDSDPSADPQLSSPHRSTRGGEQQFSYGGDSTSRCRTRPGRQRRGDQRDRGGTNACPPVPPAAPGERPAAVRGAQGAAGRRGQGRRLPLPGRGYRRRSPTSSSGRRRSPRSGRPPFRRRRLHRPRAPVGRGHAIENTASRTIGTVSMATLPRVRRLPAGWGTSFAGSPRLHGYRLDGGRDEPRGSDDVDRRHPLVLERDRLLDGRPRGHARYTLSNLELFHQADVADANSMLHQVQIRIATVDTISMGSIPATSLSTTDCDLAAHPTCKTEARADRRVSDHWFVHLRALGRWCAGGEPTDRRRSARWRRSPSTGRRRGRMTVKSRRVAL